MDQLTSIVWKALSKQDYNSYSKDAIYDMGMESLKKTISDLDFSRKSIVPDHTLEILLGRLLWVTLSTFKALGIDAEKTLKFVGGETEIDKGQVAVVELNKAFMSSFKRQENAVNTDPVNQVDNIINNDYNFSLVFGGEDGCQVMYKEFTSIGYINFVTNDEQHEVLINEFHFDSNWDNDTNKINSIALFIKAMKDKQKTDNKVYNKIYLIKEYEAFGGSSDWSSLVGFKQTNERPGWSSLYSDVFSVLEI